MILPSEGLRRGLIWTGLMLLCVCAFVSMVPTTAFAGTLDRASQSTVRVVVDLGGGESGSGSGAILDRSHVITAAHVVSGARDAAIILSSGEQFPFRIVWSDETLDVALLETESLPVKPIEIGDSSSLAAGDVVWAIGYPLGLERVSVTKGVVSSPEQRIDGQTYIQTDASINPGNSGGPLVDEKGRFVGTNVSRGETSADGRVVEGMGFAVPAAVSQGQISKYLAADSGSSDHPTVVEGSRATPGDPFSGSSAEWRQGRSSGAASGRSAERGTDLRPASSGGDSAAAVGLVAVLVLLVAVAAVFAVVARRRRRAVPAGPTVDDWTSMSGPSVTIKDGTSSRDDDWGGPIGSGPSPVDDWLR